MTRKRKNKTRNKPSVLTTENLQFHNNNNDNNINGSINKSKKSFNDERFSDSSSDSGKSEFDEEYQRNRPPPIPIDPSRVKPVKAQKPNIIINDITTNGALKNNEGEIDTTPDKLSKSKRKRLRRQRKKLAKPVQSDDVISGSLINDIQTITSDIEASSKQEFSHENFIEHSNNVVNNGGQTATNIKKKRRRKRGGQNRSSNSRNAKINIQNDNRHILLNNEAEIDTTPDKLSKSKRKRLRRQRKKLANPAQPNDVISGSLTNNIQTTVIEVPSKQECSDGNLIEHRNHVINNEEQISTSTNNKKKRRRKRGGRKRSSNSITQPTVLKQTDENIEKAPRISRNAKINRKNDNRHILLNEHRRTYAEIVAQGMVIEMAKVMSELLFPIFDLKSTVRSSHHMFLAAVADINESIWETEYARIPLLVDTTDCIHYEEVKTDQKRRKRKKKNKKASVIESDSNSERIRHHLSYAEIVKTKVNTRTTGEQ